ncbi:Leucine-rich repeat [Artemisia annua]|uniref:Leucine-rich repeat n=1 Tax=Artemisia annua TaxID=35608 RepID=A0A2U1NRN8_ARTAN|nr:Leucine-rich repeat [Artemisia annua]
MASLSAKASLEWRASHAIAPCALTKKFQFMFSLSILDHRRQQSFKRRIEITHSTKVVAANGTNNTVVLDGTYDEFEVKVKRVPVIENKQDDFHKSILDHRRVGIETLLDKLKHTLKELYVDDCKWINAKKLMPWSVKLEHLEVLWLKLVPNVHDDFVVEIVAACRKSLKELNLAMCRLSVIQA